ncbi:MAG: hypothetical protein DRZ82_09820 [Thermoprotei archaeon]|nr:MAG: hypothetical protein DRZ82_09820 [Thermoprotei archaeon]
MYSAFPLSNVKWRVIISTLRSVSRFWLVTVLVIVLLNLVLGLAFLMHRHDNAVYAKSLDSYLVFSLDLIEGLELSKKNVAFSPLSVYAALLMLAEGSGSDTKAELLNALHLSSLDDARSWFNGMLKVLLDVSKPAKLDVTNSIWIQDGFSVNRSYVNSLKRYYLAEVMYADFKGNPVGAAKEINKWVNDKTHGFISRIVDPSSIDYMTRIVLVNTIYFKARWTKPFEEVVLGNFYTSSGVVRVNYLMGTMKVRLLKEHDCIALSLDYKGTDVKFVVIMPKDGDLVKFIKGLDKDRLLDLLSRLFSSKRVTVDLYVPKFDVDSGILSLKELLMNLGVKSVFDPHKADLSPMVEGKLRSLYVRDVLHRARVKVDLAGTEAAAATAAIMVFTAVPESHPIIRIDRPFIFLLVERRSYTILFIGSIVNPQ